MFHNHHFYFYNHPYRRLGVPTWYHTYEQYKERYWQYVVGWYWHQINQDRQDPEWKAMSFPQQMEVAQQVAYEEEWKRYTQYQNQQAMKMANQETESLLDQQSLPNKPVYKTFWFVLYAILLSIGIYLLIGWQPNKRVENPVQIKEYPALKEPEIQEDQFLKELPHFQRECTESCVEGSENDFSMKYYCNCTCAQVATNIGNAYLNGKVKSWNEVSPHMSEYLPPASQAQSCYLRTAQ